LVAALGTAAEGQADSAARRRGADRDTITVQGGIYNRPYLLSGSRISVGGYVEGNLNYFVTDGVTEGLSYELRRFNLFVYSGIAPRFTFTSELEFEHGTEEISLETALVDFAFTPAFVLRAGILLIPIGGFNQAHDSPRYDFIDRPLVSTEILPATFSDVGFGAHGRIQTGRGALTYDAYLTNGLSDEFMLGRTARTRIADGKSEERFGESINGVPAVSGRVAVRWPGLGEVGLSYYGSVYNRFRDEGVTIDQRRRVSLYAVDASTSVLGVRVSGEVAAAHIDVPPELTELVAGRQWGFYLDLVAPVARPRVFGLANAAVEVGVRLEYADYNAGTFASTGRPIGDDVAAIVPAIAFRPTPGSVFRLNYRRERSRDFVGNPPAETGGFQFGFATYF
jgi:hypothetical protein